MGHCAIELRPATADGCYLCRFLLENCYRNLREQSIEDKDFHLVDASTQSMKVLRILKGQKVTIGTKPIWHYFNVVAPGDSNAAELFSFCL